MGWRNSSLAFPSETRPIKEKDNLIYGLFTTGELLKLTEVAWAIHDSENAKHAQNVKRLKDSLWEKARY